MKEQESGFSPEAIDALTGREPGRQLLPDEQRLIRDVYSLSRDYSRENERSLERIWNRLAQGQEQSVRLQQHEAGAAGLFMEGKAMEPKDIYQELLQERRDQGVAQVREFSTLDSQPGKRSRRSLRSTIGMSAAAAVVLLTVLSWAVLSSGLRHSAQNPGVGANQASFHTGTLLCSFSDNNSAQKAYPMQPSLEWTANGQILATYNNLQVASAQNCALTRSIPGSFDSTSLSPDGKRLLVASQATLFTQVLDASTGQVIASFPAAYPKTGTGSAQSQSAGISPMSSFSGGPNGASPVELVDGSAWSTDGTQVISLTTKQDSPTTSVTRVVVWDASTGAIVRVVKTFAPALNGQLPFLSPDGKFVAIQTITNSIEIWSVASGQKVSTIPFGQPNEDPDNRFPSAVAWSPDDASLALGLPNAAEVQIWSTANGTLTNSFRDLDAVNPVTGKPAVGLGYLAWSPDGKYLAESASDIHIWDVSAHKIVATFGRVSGNHWIDTLAWSPDSKMLASTYSNSGKGADFTLNTVNIWKLS